MTVDLPALSDLAAGARDAPVLLRGVVGAAGVLLLAFGGRVYRPALVLGSAGAGAVGGVVAAGVVRDLAGITLAPLHVAVAAVVGAVMLAAVASAVHRLAMLGLGAMAGLVVGTSLGSVGLTAWWVPVAAAGVGAAGFLFLERPLLRVLTALAGAALVAWAAAMPHSLWVVGGLCLVGVAIQTWMARS